MHEALEKVNQREFKQALNAALETVEVGEVAQAVQEYITENKIENVEVTDIQKIAIKVNEILKQEHKHIEVTSQLTDSIRDDLKRKIKEDGNFVTKEDLKAEKQSGRSAGKQRLKRAKASTTDGTTLRSEHERKADDSTAGEKDVSDKAENVVTSEGKQPINLHMKKQEPKVEGRILITEEELDKKVDEAIKGMSHEEIISLMTESLQKQENIMVSALQRQDNLEMSEISQKYEPVMRIVQKLDELNKKYEKTNGELIYPDIKTLVEDIRNFFAKGKGGTE